MTEKCRGRKLFFYIHTKILHGQLMPLNYAWRVSSVTIDFVLCFVGILS